MRIRVLLALGLALVTLAVLAAAPADATTAPVLACGSTVFDRCSETAHFDEVNQWEMPLGTATGCPAYIADDFALIVGTGNGVEHNTINGGGYFWTTSTFTGNVSITFYDPSRVTVTTDDQGNITDASVTGPADNTVTGRFTQTFGVEQTRQTEVFGQTFSVDGTDLSGATIRLRGTQHMNWTQGGNMSSAPPQHAKFAVNC